MSKEIQENTNESTKLYEVGFHIVPTVDESSANDEFEAIKKFLTEKGAKIYSEIKPEFISLAYEMSRSTGGSKEWHNKSFFASIKFNAEPTVLTELKELIDHNEKIIRHIIVKTVVDGEHTTSKINETLKKQNKKEERVDVSEVVSEEIETVDVEEKTEEEVDEVEVDKAIDEIIK